MSVLRRIQATFPFWHNNRVLLPLVELTWTTGTRHVPLCTRSREHSSDWPRGGPVRTRAPMERRSHWTGRRPWRSGLHNPPRTQHSRREAGAGGTRERGRNSTGWPRCVTPPSSVSLRDPPQVHVWVGREREQSCYKLGNHLLWPLYLAFFYSNTQNNTLQILHQHPCLFISSSHSCPEARSVEQFGFENSRFRT